MGRKPTCKLCLKMTSRNGITKINTLPKTFTIILEEMSGIKFSKVDSLDMVICFKCLQFLQNMDSSSANNSSKSNKITPEGKKRVFRLMEKRRMPAAAAIDLVLAEQRAKELLVASGIKKTDSKGNLVDAPPQPQPEQLLLPALTDSLLPKRRLSGAQRKKATILMNAGMDPAAARQLVYAAKLAKEAFEVSNSNSTTQITDNRQEPMGQRRAGRRGARRARDRRRDQPQVQGRARSNDKPRAARTPRNDKPKAAQADKPKAVENAPVKKVDAIKPLMALKNVQDPKDSNQKGTAANKSTISPGILIAPTRRQRNNSGGRKRSNSGGRVGAVVPSRRNERPAPYSNNRRQTQQNQQNQQNQSQQNNSNFNQNNQQKQQQQQQRQNNSSLEVGIVPINYPNSMLDDMKLDALKEAITNEILKIPPGGPLIRFLGTSSQNGWLKINCADQLSYKWLAMLVSRWERAGVRLVEGNALPDPEILSFYLQGDFRSPDEILSIIEKQNNSLNANQWRVIDRESDGNGQRITVSVTERCFQALRNRDFVVFLGLGVVELKPRRSNSNNNGSFNLNSGNDNNYSNYGGNNNMQNNGNNGGRGGSGGSGNFGNDNYNSNYNRNMDSGRNSSNNYQNQGRAQGYQRERERERVGYQSQRAW